MSTQPFIIIDYDVPAAEPLPEVKNEVRCHETDRADVTAVCHHSGRFLSSAAEAKPQFYQDHSLEFADILTDKEAQGAHSKAYAHFLPYSPLKVLIIPGIILSLLGVGLLVSVLPKVFSMAIFSRLFHALQVFSIREIPGLMGPVISSSWEPLLLPFTLLIIGLLLLIVGANQYRIFKRISMSRPLDAIPLLSEYYNVVVNERLTLPLSLSLNGDPYIDRQAIKGEGNIALEIFMDGQEIEKSRRAYREKGKKYGFPARDDFNLGWLYVQPSPYTKFETTQHLLAMRQTIPALDNPEITNWFTAATYHYSIRPDLFFSETSLPQRLGQSLLWVRPTLKKYSAGHTLQIEFEILNPPEAANNKPKDSYIKPLVDKTFLEKLRHEAVLQSIELKVKEHPFPGSTTCPIERSRGRISINRNEVQWRNMPLSQVLAGKAEDKPDSYPLTITFTEPLTNLDSSIEISFNIVINGASLSGIEVSPNYFWLPNGRSAKDSQRNFTTTYNTEISGTLSVQPEMFAFEQEITATQSLDMAPGIPLNSEVLTKLICELEQDVDTQIKSVVKSIPVVEAENNLAYHKRSWNISGRVYTKNNHPLDFHILLISRTPLVEGPTITWGSVTYRCLRVNRKSSQPVIAADLQQEMNSRCKSLHRMLVQLLQPKDTLPDWQVSMPRILSQS